MKTGFKLRSPASLVFDSLADYTLAVALDSCANELTINTATAPGLHIKSISGNKKRIKKDPAQNPAALAFQYAMTHLGVENYALSFDLNQEIPIGRGLGSMASLAVAGAHAACTCLEKDDPLLVYRSACHALEALKIDFQASQIKACLQGGICYHDPLRPDDLIKLPSPRGLFFLVFIPVSTEIQPIAWEDKNAKADIGQVVRFISALYLNNLEHLASVLRHSLRLNTETPLHQKLGAIIKGGAGLALGMSGSTTFVLCQNTLEAQDIITQVSEEVDGFSARYEPMISPLTAVGVHKM